MYHCQFRSSKNYDEKMKIAIINTLAVPSGQASVNRFLGYAQGLVKQGDEVTCLSSAKPIIRRKGMLGGVEYINFGTNDRLSLVKSLIAICQNLHYGSYKVVIVVSNSLFLIYPIYWICKYYGIKMIMEKSEFPFTLMRDGYEIKPGWEKKYGMYWVKTASKLVDGLIVMTHPLMNFYKSRVNRNCKLVHVPMTVDTTRFNIPKSPSIFGEYIAYCGNMTGNKDGVENLLSAFKEVEPRYPNLKLLLIGSCNTEEQFEERKAQVMASGLKNVVFYGRALRDEMPKLLKNAMMLCLARPTTTQATYGFPTKLGEYLSTGNPVVITAVGDIPMYLNNDNSFIVKADDNQAFAQRMLEVLGDYDHAKLVGERGKQLAKEIFNADVQAKILHDWLHKEFKATN